MRGKITKQDDTIMFNNISYIDFEDRLKMLAVSLFKWENLDKICGTGSARFLEKVLFEEGRAVFVKDPELGFLILRANPDDKFNIYELPTKIYAWSLGYNKIYNFDDVVYIMNNELTKPTRDILSLFAYRLYDTVRTTDINMNAQKTPVLLEGDTKSILTLKNVYQKYSGNEPVIFGNKNFEMNNRLNVLKTDAPYIIDKLDMHKHELFNDAMTILGINNSNTDKKERLITDEVNSNDQLISNYLNCYYKKRKEACDMINEKFLADSDLKISISLNKDVMDLLQDTNGGEDDGELYNNDKDTD